MLARMSPVFFIKKVLMKTEERVVKNRKLICTAAKRLKSLEPFRSPNKEKAERR